jgi:hypothetical protein
MLSALLITCDSAPWLAYVLANCRTWADEVVVVVDTASTDDTYAVAQQHANRVEQWAIGGYLELVLQRAATELCAGDWIMRLDDDELMPPDFAEMVRWLMARKDTDDYAFQRLALVEDGSLMAKSPDLWPDLQIRLRSKSAYHLAPWPPTIHSQPPGTRRWIVQTDNATIWHLRELVRSAAQLKARLAQMWQLDPDNMARVDGWLQRIAAPWQVLPTPEPPPVELVSLLTALGNPVRHVELFAHTAANHMRTSGSLILTIGLQQLADELAPDTVMAEVGVYGGEGSRIFVESGKVRRLYAVDPWAFDIHDPKLGLELFSGADVEAAFDVLALAYPQQIFKIKAASPQVASCFHDGELDAVYIDADHSYAACAADIAAWTPKVKPDGIVAGHDYSTDWPGVIRAVNEAFGKPDKLFPDTSWLVHKHNGRTK